MKGFLDRTVLFQPFKSFKPFKTIQIGKSARTPCTLRLFVNTNLLGESIPAATVCWIFNRPLRAIALTPLSKKSPSPATSTFSEFRK